MLESTADELRATERRKPWLQRRVARLEGERYRGELSDAAVALGAVARRKGREEGEARARGRRDAFQRAARALLPSALFEAVENEARVLERTSTFN